MSFKVHFPDKTFVEYSSDEGVPRIGEALVISDTSPAEVYRVEEVIWTLDANPKKGYISARASVFVRRVSAEEPKPRRNFWQRNFIDWK